jgi:hypothetical protein
MDSSLTIIGFLFTLISLLGSFFYIQISNWYSEVLELNKKYEENKEKTNAEMKDAIRECRYEYKKLFNFVPVITTIAISGFLIFISERSFFILNGIQSDKNAVIIQTALFVFLAIYFTLMLVFIVGGLVYSIKLKKIYD